MKKYDFTTISIKKITKKRLRKQKVHPRETWDGVLNRLIDNIPSSSKENSEGGASGK